MQEACVFPPFTKQKNHSKLIKSNDIALYFMINPLKILCFLLLLACALVAADIFIKNHKTTKNQPSVTQTDSQKIKTVHNDYMKNGITQHIPNRTLPEKKNTEKEPAFAGTEITIPDLLDPPSKSEENQENLSSALDSNIQQDTVLSQNKDLHDQRLQIILPDTNNNQIKNYSVAKKAEPEEKNSNALSNNLRTEPTITIVSAEATVSDKITTNNTEKYIENSERQEPLKENNNAAYDVQNIKSGSVVIIIDDMGLSHRGREVENLPGPLTLSYLPYADNLSNRTAYAKAKGHELMVHMPMEALHSNLDEGATFLKIGQSEDELRKRLTYNLSRFEGYVGINNHMGSRLTQDEKSMQIVMQELKNRNLYFIDSKTIGSSIAASIAAKNGLYYEERDVFLDHEITPEYIASALKQTEKIAKSKGYAIAIGHPHHLTIEALKKWLPTLEEKGLTLVPASAVVHRYGSAKTLIARNDNNKEAEESLQTQQKETTSDTSPYVITKEGIIVLPKTYQSPIPQPE